MLFSLIGSLDLLEVHVNQACLTRFTLYVYSLNFSVCLSVVLSEFI